MAKFVIETHNSLGSFGNKKYIETLTPAGAPTAFTETDGLGVNWYNIKEWDDTVDDPATINAQVTALLSANMSSNPGSKPPKPPGI